MLNLGVLLDGQGKPDEAEEWWRKAADAGHLGAKSNRGPCSLSRASLSRPRNGGARPPTPRTQMRCPTWGALLDGQGKAEEAEERHRKVVATESSDE